MPSIKALNIYPVKSCRGIALDEGLITPMGFRFDRQWMIVGSNYRFLTQREEPRMALIETALSERHLTLRAPGMVADLQVPLDTTGQPIQAVCWRDVCAGHDSGEAAARWLSEYLGAPRRLVRFDPNHKRASSREWTGDIEALNQFSDGFPWLVISHASLDDLNARLATPLPMNRFRPNIVIDSVPPYAEDRIHELFTDRARWRIVKPCTRCAITTTDQASGERTSDEPLRTLKSYRFSRELRGVLFGQNAVLIEGSGETVRVGQHLQIEWKA